MNRLDGLFDLRNVLVRGPVSDICIKQYQCGDLASTEIQKGVLAAQGL